MLNDDDDDESFQKFLHMHWQIDLLNPSFFNTNVIILCTPFCRFNKFSIPTPFSMLPYTVLFGDGIIFVTWMGHDIFNCSHID